MEKTGSKKQMTTAAALGLIASQSDFKTQVVLSVLLVIYLLADLYSERMKVSRSQHSKETPKT